MKIKLAEALLRRKELQQKVDQIRPLKESQVFYTLRSQRIKVHEGLEDLHLDMPKLELNQVTEEYDYYSRALRLIDAYIQQANWTCELDVDERAINDYKQKT